MAISRDPGSTYAVSTKQSIIREVHRGVGRTGGQIAEALGLERRRVNSFLYGEGKRVFGLEERDWRWYPALVPLPRPPRRPPPAGITPPPPPQPPAPRPQSICAVLAAMPEYQAVLRMRTFSLDVVELAFAEEDYALLSDSLRAELAARRAVLLASLPKAARASARPPRWLLWALGLGALITVLNIMNSPRGADPPPLSPRIEVQ